MFKSLSFGIFQKDSKVHFVIFLILLVLCITNGREFKNLNHIVALSETSSKYCGKTRAGYEGKSNVRNIVVYVLWNSEWQSGSIWIIDINNMDGIIKKKYPITDEQNSEINNTNRNYRQIHASILVRNTTSFLPLSLLKYVRIIITIRRPNYHISRARMVAINSKIVQHIACFETNAWYV